MKFASIVKGINRTVKWGILASLFHVSWMCSSQIIGSNSANNITSQNHLELLIAQEKKKLGCNKKITGHYFYHIDKAMAGKLKDGAGYIIEIGGYWKNEHILRHEVYHICDGHTDSTLKVPLYSLAYFFWYEPQAEIYAAIGLKL